ncbi:MAG: DUF1318 domain-containing protein, partial [Verrucomicrobiae bacterium]|nr:DUF1318 domain-containing protein [Verrucomicrobiae bacterium]
MNRFSFSFSSVNNLFNGIFPGVCSVLVIGLLQLAESAELGEIQKRIFDRQKQIEQILRDRKAGEDQFGLLQPRDGLPKEGKDLVESENVDRQAIFIEIGKQTGKNPEEVGQARASQIRDRLKPGILRMVQDPGGAWVWSDGVPQPPPPPVEVLKLLTRPGASLYREPDGEVLRSGLTQFTMFDVMDRGNGADGALWYRVAESGSAAAGWLRESETLEWRQALVMDYTSQRDRSRTLFFEDKEELRRLASTNNPERGQQVSLMAGMAASGQNPGHSVIAIEPVFDPITQEKTPVIIPIIEHEPFTIDGARDT